MAIIKYLYKEYPTLVSRCMKCWALTHVVWPTGKIDVTLCNCDIEAVEPIRVALERLTPKEKGTLTDEDLSDLNAVILSVDKDRRGLMGHMEWLHAFVNKHATQYLNWDSKRFWDSKRNEKHQ